jgi:hypothetical protein
LYPIFMSVSQYRRGSERQKRLHETITPQPFTPKSCERGEKVVFIFSRRLNVFAARQKGQKLTTADNNFAVNKISMCQKRSELVKKHPTTFYLKWIVKSSENWAKNWYVEHSDNKRQFFSSTVVKLSLWLNHVECKWVFISAMSKAVAARRQNKLGPGAPWENPRGAPHNALYLSLSNARPHLWRTNK